MDKRTARIDALLAAGKHKRALLLAMAPRTAYEWCSILLGVGVFVALIVKSWPHH